MKAGIESRSAQTLSLSHTHTHTQCTYRRARAHTHAHTHTWQMHTEKEYPPPPPPSNAIKNTTRPPLALGLNLTKLVNQPNKREITQTRMGNSALAHTHTHTHRSCAANFPFGWLLANTKNNRLLSKLMSGYLSSRMNRSKWKLDSARGDSAGKWLEIQDMFWHGRRNPLPSNILWEWTLVRFTIDHSWESIFRS